MDRVGDTGSRFGYAMVGGLIVSQALTFFTTAGDLSFTYDRVSDLDRAPASGPLRRKGH